MLVLDLVVVGSNKSRKTELESSMKYTRLYHFINEPNEACAKTSNRSNFKNKRSI